MNADLVFSGKLGSGKTAVSKMLAARIGARWNGFGATVKRIAAERELQIERHVLQVLGEELVQKSPDAFCRRVIAEAIPQSGTTLVLDGLRHLSILEQLRKLLSPRRVILIFVDVQEPIRLERILKREDCDLHTLKELESHSTEIQVMTELRSSAESIVDNSGALASTVEGIQNYLRLANF
jgi:cytidylate kinase